MIAQSKAIPSMLIPNASALIKNNDFVLMDATRGIVIVNPNQDNLDFYQIKGVEQHEL
jgi:phosphoenolpyruvate-protein kinase (PTS system EI component)